MPRRRKNKWPLLIMSYFVYENNPTDKTRIHYSDCPYCSDGLGCHNTTDTSHGRWKGPFPSYADARQAALATRRTVSDCRHCRPHTD
jgi:hypothetical protein